MENKRVLIIDDQPESIALLVEFLSDKSFDILVALDGEDGLRKARQGQPDLILLDVLMPGLDGLAVCKQLKSEQRTVNTPVVFLSASADIANKLAGFEQGAVDYVTKPFSQEEVLARIQLHLQTKQKIERLDAHLTQHLIDVAKLPPHQNETFFLKAVAILEKRLSNPPTVIELANQLGTNENKINKIFRKQTGMSLGEYIHDLRLESSRRFLIENNIQIRLIADSVGYRNAGDFTRAFKMRYGTTPREYRKNNSKQ